MLFGVLDVGDKGFFRHTFIDVRKGDEYHRQYPLDKLRAPEVPLCLLDEGLEHEVQYGADTEEAAFVRRADVVKLELILERLFVTLLHGGVLFSLRAAPYPQKKQRQFRPYMSQLEPRDHVLRQPDTAAPVEGSIGRGGPIGGIRGG